MISLRVINQESDNPAHLFLLTMGEVSSCNRDHTDPTIWHGCWKVCTPPETGLAFSRHNPTSMLPASHLTKTETDTMEQRTGCSVSTQKSRSRAAFPWKATGVFFLLWPIFWVEELTFPSTSSNAEGKLLTSQAGTESS